MNNVTVRKEQEVSKMYLTSNTSSTKKKKKNSFGIFGLDKSISSRDNEMVLQSTFSSMILFSTLICFNGFIAVTVNVFY